MLLGDVGSHTWAPGRSWALGDAGTKRLGCAGPCSGHSPPASRPLNEKPAWPGRRVCFLRRLVQREGQGHCVPRQGTHVRPPRQSVWPGCCLPGVLMGAVCLICSTRTRTWWRRACQGGSSHLEPLASTLRPRGLMTDCSRGPRPLPCPPTLTCLLGHSRGRTGSVTLQLSKKRGHPLRTGRFTQGVGALALEKDRLGV